MSDDIDREEERDFDPSDLKKRSAFDLLDDEEISDEEFHKVPKVTVDEDNEEEEDGYAFYDAEEEWK